MPPVRGPWSEQAQRIMLDDVHGSVPDAPTDVPADHDLQLALYLCYELSYQGIAGVPDHLDSDPRVMALRREMEELFVEALQESVPFAPVDRTEVAPLLREIDSASTMPLARFMAAEADLDQAREFVVHRSAYHLKEADPHTLAIPRLSGAAKAAFVEIQADEYGAGDPGRAHSTLFAKMMRGMGLDDSYGAYVERLPGITLATVNLMSLFGSSRRWRGAAVGHLALFELGSSRPNRLYGDGLRRLGFGPDVTDFHDEHVEADAVHSMIATYDLAARLAADEPELAADIVFGARALDELEGRASALLLDRWRGGSTSLLPAPV